MEDHDIETLRDGNVDSIKAALPDLSTQQLTELLAEEVADANPRKGVTEAVEAILAARDDAGDEGSDPGADNVGADNPEPAPAPPVSKRNVSKPTAKPAWQKPDYSGPLDCEQAAWRRLHLKGRG